MPSNIGGENRLMLLSAAGTLRNAAAETFRLLLETLVGEVGKR